MFGFKSSLSLSRHLHLHLLYLSETANAESLSEPIIRQEEIGSSCGGGRRGRPRCMLVVVRCLCCRCVSGGGLLLRVLLLGVLVLGVAVHLVVVIHDACSSPPSTRDGHRESWCETEQPGGEKSLDASKTFLLTPPLFSLISVVPSPPLSWQQGNERRWACPFLEQTREISHGTRRDRTRERRARETLLNHNVFAPLCFFALCCHHKKLKTRPDPFKNEPPPLSPALSFAFHRPFRFTVQEKIKAVHKQQQKQQFTSAGGVVVGGALGQKKVLVQNQKIKRNRS